MKGLSIYLTVLVLLDLATCSDGFDVDAEREILESSAQELYRVFEIQNHDETNRYIAAEFTGFFSNPRFDGALGREAWDNQLVHPGSATVIERDWMITPDMAVSTSLEAWSVHAFEEGDYLITMVWEKIDGDWKVVHLHMSELD
jgi:hypothetical protein